jgi:tetratricopeptide (TPR) repeat protein
VNQIENLERKLDRLLKEPDNSKLFNEIGAFLYQMKDWENAEMYFERALKLNPVDEEIMYNYALLLCQQYQWDKAIPAFEAYLELHQDDQEIMKKMGDSYYCLGEYESAAKMYEQLRKKGESGL